MLMKVLKFSACLKFILRGFSVASETVYITVVFQCLSVTHYLNISSMLWHWFDFYFHSLHIHMHEIKQHQIISLRRRLWDLPLCQKGKITSTVRKHPRIFYLCNINAYVSKIYRTTWVSIKKSAEQWELAKAITRRFTNYALNVCLAEAEQTCRNKR